jgi:glutamyl-tRNA reductase
VGGVLASLGASYHDVDLATLERLSTQVGVERDLYALTDEPASGTAGVVVLATCNRFEVYLDLDRFHDGIDAAVSVLARLGTDSVDDLAALLRVRVGTDAVAHLFRVTSGLESMVVGETQISGQVSAALDRSQAAGRASSELHLVFQSAAHVAKRVAADTDLQASGRSIASTALDLAERQTGVPSRGPVLLIGTGAYARVVTAALQDRGLSDIAVYSPTGRQDLFATPRGLAAIGAEKLPDALASAQFVVTCSGRQHPVLDRRAVEVALHRRDMPLCIVDLALDRDVPAEVRAMDRVEVIDLAAVAAAVAKETAASRSSGESVDGSSGKSVDGSPGESIAAAVAQAEALIDDAVADFQRRRADRAVAPAIVALRSHVTATIDREIERLLPRIPGDAADEVRHAAHRIARALLHTPSVRAQEVARNGRASDYIRAIHLLFGIDLSAGGGAGDTGPVDRGGPEAPAPRMA